MAGMFHLFTHAMFKALLFLGAGAIIHAVHSNEMSHMGGLRKQVAEFQGKVAVSHDDLMQTIKDAIKDGLKGMVVGGVAAGAAVAGADAAEAAPAEENAVPDDFGFGASGSNSDGFGF